MSAELQGNGSPQESQGQAPPEGGQSEQPKALTPEDFNRAFTARAKDFDKKIEARITEALTSATGKLEGSLLEKLGALISGKQAQPDAADEAVAGQQPQAVAGATGPQKDPEVTALKRQLTEMKNKLAAQDTERENERAALRDSRMRASLGDKLVALGIDAKRVRHAVGFLVDAEKLVSVDSSGGLVFKASDGDVIDIESGLREWIGSDDGKLYLPPRGVAGSGSEAKQNHNAARSNAASDPRSVAIRAIAEKYRMG